MKTEHEHFVGFQTSSRLTIFILIFLSFEDLYVSGSPSFLSHVSNNSAFNDTRVRYLHDCSAVNNKRRTNIDNASIYDIEGSHVGNQTNLTELRGMCPGVVEFYKEAGLAMYPVKVTDCNSWYSVINLRFQNRWLYGQCRDSSSFCYVFIQVPRNMNIRARIELYKDLNTKSPESRWDFQTFDKQYHIGWLCSPESFMYKLPRRKILHFMSSTNQLYLYYKNRPPIRITFKAVKPKLNVRYYSRNTGVVTTPYLTMYGSICDQLKVPNGHVIIVSFESIRNCVTSLYESGNIHEMKYVNVMKVYNTTHVHVCYTSFTFYDQSCFKMLFSFHPEGTVPQILKGGLYNCSVHYYWRFRQHLQCNIEVQCEDGRDEAEHCPFHSPVCPGGVEVYHKCYMLFRFNKMTPYRARDACRIKGFQMPKLKTEQEVNVVETMLLKVQTSVYVGLTCGLRSQPFLYAWLAMWSDKTAVYNANYFSFPSFLRCVSDSYFLFYPLYSGKPRIMRPTDEHFYVLCENKREREDVFVSQSVKYSHSKNTPFTLKTSRQSLVTCQGHHVTHEFLSCDRKSRCGKDACYFNRATRDTSEFISTVQHSADSTAMFACSSGDTEVAYSLLCDFRQDCADNSDESFCHHPACKEFTCTNGQCVPSTKHCNSQMDCLDGSDERHCRVTKEQTSCFKKAGYQNQNDSFLINFDGRGCFTLQVMNRTDPCPSSHYLCTKEWFYCLPVYTRCNGVFDCIFQEDERDCDRWTCPGLYRCRDSTVCVLAEHMCDGWPQCPQRDDEWLCDMICPAQCLCQGHAFLCRQPFSAHHITKLRYLDAKGSLIIPSDVMNNTYMVRLSLAQCFISHLPDMKFPNLQFLDLGYNKLTSIATRVFTNTPNLQILVLRWNPLISITTYSSKTLKALIRIDLSGIHFDVFRSKLFTLTPKLQHLNVSFPVVQSTGPQGFQMLPHLKELDIRGSTIEEFSSNLFGGLNRMETIYAPHYRLCCEGILPYVIPQPRCLAPQHYLSSCNDMMRSEVYRINFWFLVVLASLGNLVCVVCYSEKTVITMPYGGSVVVYMASLQCADFCIGIYASVIATAQETFRGQYVLFEDRWAGSGTCKVAGFLSLLSGEVSVLSTCLLTLEHLVLLVFPHSTYSFSKPSAAVACGVAWFVGILLATVPLLPGLSKWGRYGQTAVCSLMLRDRRNANDKFYFIHAILVFNIFICLTVFVFLIIVYRATPQHRFLIKQNRNPAYASVDLLVKIAALDVARWITVTTTSVLVSSGVAGIETNVFIAVMVLPLNAAVNPLLCLWHAVTYKRRQKQEERLLRVLQSRRKCLGGLSDTMKRGNDHLS